MFKTNIDFYYRIICLLSFVVILLFSDNIITYGILGIVWLIYSFRYEKKELYLLLIITVLTFIINSNFLIKFILCIDYIVYFMYMEEKESNINFDTYYKDNKKEITSLLGKGEIDNKIEDDIYKKTISDIEKKKETDLLRFNNNYQDTKLNYYYVIFHLIILFLSILIGSCVT